METNEDFAGTSFQVLEIPLCFPLNSAINAATKSLCSANYSV
jgi:hypothetical protein